MNDTVWLHGTALCGLRWGPCPDALWPDLPGHGSAPRVRPRVEAYAEALLPGLPARFAIAGHSLGGMVALTIAARVPERCRALVLMDAPLGLPRWMLPRLGRRLVPLMCRFPGPRGFGRLVARRTANRAARPAVRDTIAGTAPDGLADAMTAVARFDGDALLPRLTMPVLCLLGRRSPLTGRREARAFAAHGAEVRIFDTGHMLPFDAPDRVDPLMRAFLERHP
jgi:pimeloyl-ACP methyl ester carboxylesterase